VLSIHQGNGVEIAWVRHLFARAGGFEQVAGDRLLG
jgi:hypothetical protein